MMMPRMHLSAHGFTPIYSPSNVTSVGRSFTVIGSHVFVCNGRRWFNGALWLRFDIGAGVTAHVWRRYSDVQGDLTND